MFNTLIIFIVEVQRNDVHTQNKSKELAGLCCVGYEWREVHMKKTGFLNPFLG